MYRMAKKKVKTKDEVTETNLSDSLLDSVYINPLTDFGFKRLFYNKELLIPFLNDMIGTDLKDVTYQPTEGLGWYSVERTAIFDILCTNIDDEHFVVEMQFIHQTHFRDRALFYGSHIIRKQAPRKKRWNFDLKKAYIVSILNFVEFTDKESKNKVFERVYLYRESNKELFLDKLQMIFVELPKFNKTVSELKDNRDTWLYLLKNTVGLKSCPPEITGKPFKLFLEIAEKNQLTPTEMKSYGSSLKRTFEGRDIANYARMEGRIERSKQFAIKLLKRNEPIEEIMYLSELTREQIDELLSQIPKS